MGSTDSILATKRELVNVVESTDNEIQLSVALAMTIDTLETRMPGFRERMIELLRRAED